MEKIIIYKEENLDYETLFEYLKLHTNLHSVPKDIFARKIIKYGNIFTARDLNGFICGIACVYYNRKELDFGFLSFINVNKEMRGLHIGSSLLDLVIGKGKKLGFKSLKLQVNSENLIALSLYKKNCFRMEKKDGIYLFLCKKL